MSISFLYISKKQTKSVVKKYCLQYHQNLKCLDINPMVGTESICEKLQSDEINQISK